MKPATTTRIFICGLLVVSAGAACSAPADLAVTPDPPAALALDAPDASDALALDAPDPPAALALDAPDASDALALDAPDPPAALALDAPDGPIAPVAPRTLAAIVECDVVPLGELAGSETVRFVAYGDVDRGDDVGCGMVPNARLAVVNGHDDSLDWWELENLGVRDLAPPGLQIPSSGERLSAASVRFLTMGPGGGASEAFIGNVGRYTVCAMSPVVRDLIAGCNHEQIWLGYGSEVYVFFSHGHAIVEAGPEAADRYQRFLDGADISDQPRVSVFFVSASVSDVSPFVFLVSNRQVAIIEDVYVDAWWSGADLVFKTHGAFRFDPGVLENEWVHVISTGDDGLAEVALTPGDYLFCHVSIRSEVNGYSAGCDHENIPDSNGRVIVIELAAKYLISTRCICLQRATEETP